MQLNLPANPPLNRHPAEQQNRLRNRWCSALPWRLRWKRNKPSPVLGSTTVLQTRSETDQNGAALSGFRYPADRSLVNNAYEACLIRSAIAGLQLSACICLIAPTKASARCV